MRELTGEAADEASWAASGVNERDQSTMPPETGISLNFGIEWNKPCLYVK
jgi:hypothetical protein